VVPKGHWRAGRSGADEKSAKSALMKASALGALSCAVATAGLMIPADAAVRAGHTVFVLKNDSIVEAEGLTPGANVTVRVLRDGVEVGSAVAEANLEGIIAINHDSCWSNFTPTILPGDQVVVNDGAGQDTVRVANISVRQGPVRVGDTFTIQGTAPGRPPVGQLMVEARTNDPIRFRPLAPDVVDGVRGTIEYDGPTGGDFTATFTGMTAEQQQAADNLGEFLVAVVADRAAGDPKEMTIATDANPVPGPGCAIDAPARTHGVTNLSRDVINKANRNKTLRVSGMTLNADAVSVSLRDGDGTVVTRRATLNGTGTQTWVRTFEPAALRGLSGRIRVSGQYTVGTTTLNGTTMTLLKDLVAPRRPTASPRGGTYTRRQAVSLSAPAGTQVRYTLGRSPARPTRFRGLVYRGRQISITASQVLKAIAVDKAGNVSRVNTQRYVIR